MTLGSWLDRLKADFVEGLDPLFPKPFGEDGYRIAELPWTGRGVGIYPSFPQGYVIDNEDMGMKGYISIDIDCGHTSLADTIRYLDALLEFIASRYSGMTVDRAYCDTSWGQQGDQSCACAVCVVTLDYHHDGERNLSPSFV